MPPIISGVENQCFNPCAAAKSIFCDFGDRFRDGQVGHAAILKCIGFYGRDGITQREACNPCAALEGAVADNGDRIGDSYLGQTCAIVKRIMPDGRERIREDDFCELFAGIERIVTDTCHRVGKGDMEQVDATPECFVANGNDGIGFALMGNLGRNNDVAAIAVEVPIVGDDGLAVLHIIADAVNHERIPVFVGIAEDCGEVSPNYCRFIVLNRFG